MLVVVGLVLNIMEAFVHPRHPVPRRGALQPRQASTACSRKSSEMLFLVVETRQSEARRARLGVKALERFTMGTIDYYMRFNDGIIGLGAQEQPFSSPDTAPGSSIFALSLPQTFDLISFPPALPYFKVFPSSRSHLPLLFLLPGSMIVAYHHPALALVCLLESILPPPKRHLEVGSVPIGRFSGSSYSLTHFETKAPFE